MNRHPTPFQLRTIWNAITGVSILVLGGLLVGLIWLTGNVLSFLQPVVVPLAVAGIIAYLLDPVVRWFEERKLSRLKAVIATFSLFLLIITVLILITIPMVGNQINEFRSKNSITENADAEPRKPFNEATIDTLVRTRNGIPWTQPFIDGLLASPNSTTNDRENLTKTLDQIRDQPPSDRAETSEDPANPAQNAKPSDATPETSDSSRHDIVFAETNLWHQLKDLSDNALNWVRQGTSKILGYIGLIIGFIMVPIYLYYFLKDSASIRDHWHEYIPLKASKLKNEVVETLTEINGYMISFFRGQVFVAFIDGLLIGIALTLFGLPLGLLIGIMMAILGIIPFVGNILTLIPACLIAWFHYSDPANASILGNGPTINIIAVAGIFFIAQQINSMVTAPKIVGDSVGLHPMTVIFSMIFWSLVLGGFVGALLAVPLTASVKVLFRRYIWERRIQAEPA